MKQLFLSIFTLSLLLGCGDNQASEKDNPNQDQVGIEKGDEGGSKKVSEDIINNILMSIPSPLEISMIIKESGAEYNVKDLNDHASVLRYSSTFKKAINLGIYSTDLGYANIYAKKQDAVNYLNSVKKLSDELAIGQFFDYNTIKNLAESSDKLDELIQTTTENFERINYHLREQKRESLSILLLTGGWIEISYLTTLIHERTKNETLKEKIGEQKLVLERILLVLEVYSTKPEFPALIADLKELRKVYDKIRIETSYNPPVRKQDDGGKTIVYEDATKQTIIINDDDVSAIKSLLTSIRNKVTK
jgi:hypothetical protein